MRTIVPSSLYTSLACKIAESGELDDAISALFWALRNNAEDYPVMRGYKTLRRAKTEATRNIPALHLIFKIDDKDQVVLKYIEIATSDEFQGPPIL